MSLVPLSNPFFFFSWPHPNVFRVLFPVLSCHKSCYMTESLNALRLRFPPPLLTVQLLQGANGGEEAMPVLRVGHIQLCQVALPQPHQVVHRLVAVELQRRGVLLEKHSVIANSTTVKPAEMFGESRYLQTEALQHLPDGGLLPNAVRLLVSIGTLLWEHIHVNKLEISNLAPQLASPYSHWWFGNDVNHISYLGQTVLSGLIPCVWPWLCVDHVCSIQKVDNQEFTTHRKLETQRIKVLQSIRYRNGMRAKRKSKWVGLLKS